MPEIKALPKRPSPPRANGGAAQLRTQGVSSAALQEEVDEYFDAGATVRPGDVVLDIGANVGAFALAAAERADGDLTLHCFEPAVPTFELLKRNFSDHPVLKRSKHTLNLVALTRPEDAGTERSFYFFKRFPTDSTYDIANKRREFQTFWGRHAERVERAMAIVPLLGRLLGRVARAVIEYLSNPERPFGVWVTNQVTGLKVMVCKMETLETWMREHHVPRIDLVKIDVEGAEMHVLEGFGAAWSSIRQVAIETHDRDGKRQRVVDLLRAQGFATVEAFRPRIAADNGMDNVLITARRDSAQRSAHP